MACMMNVDEFETCANQFSLMIDNLTNNFNADDWVKMIDFIDEKVESAARYMSEHHRLFVRERLFSPHRRFLIAEGKDAYLRDCRQFVDDMHALCDVDL